MNFESGKKTIRADAIDIASSQEVENNNYGSDERKKYAEDASENNPAEAGRAKAGEHILSVTDFIHGKKSQ